MVALKPPPLVERLPKPLVVGVVAFVAAPGTLTTTAALIVGSQSTSLERLLTLPLLPVAVGVALAVALSAVVVYTTSQS